MTTTTISVADTFTAPSSGSLTPGCPATTLAAAASMTCTAQHAVTQADVTNGVINDSAVATGTPAVGPAVSSARSTATVGVSLPKFDLAVTKTASSKHVTVGRPVTYTVVGLLGRGGMAVVDLAIDDTGVEITAAVETTARTGVEMEALTAASVGLLTVYDMCKAVDRGMRIDGLRLLEKSGGKSGHFKSE